MTAVGIEIEGLDKLEGKLQGEHLLGHPLKKALEDSALQLEGVIKEGTPVDTGRLRGSITSKVSSDPVPLWAKVGTGVKYAPFVEYDCKPHFPPVTALQGWARRHHVSPYVVARAIARHGTRGAHMFEKALKATEGTEGNIKARLEQASKDIEGRFQD